MANINKRASSTISTSLTFLNLCFLLVGLLMINKGLNNNKVSLNNLNTKTDSFDEQLRLILSDINISNKEISSLNLKVSVLNEELSLFNKSIIKNENDLSVLQLKIKDIIADLKEVKNMTELQNRKLYVSE